MFRDPFCLTTIQVYYSSTIRVLLGNNRRIPIRSCLSLTQHLHVTELVRPESSSVRRDYSFSIRLETKFCLVLAPCESGESKPVEFSVKDWSSASFSTTNQENIPYTHVHIPQRTNFITGNETFVKVVKAQTLKLCWKSPQPESTILKKSYLS